jgi:ribonucleoside-diphosphate reductase alpha chain
LEIEKRDGRSEELSPNKIMQVLGWACEGLSDVSAATVLMHSKLQFFEGMKSSQISETLVKSAADLINEYQPDYQYVAGRLLMTQLRKQAFGQHEVPDFYEHILELVGIGKYDKDLTNLYSSKDINELGDHIDHEKDMNYTYAAMVQWESKYLIQDRTSGDIFESPQQAIMLIGMCLFQEYPRQTRLDWVKKFYDATSDQKISLPTPIMGGVRSPTRQFSSCCLIETADSLSSINAVSNAITRYSSMRAGIGINAGAIRRMGAPIRGGEAYHTGGLGFFKTFHAALKSCSQGGIRGGAGTLFFPWWHYDVESYLVLKNNKGTEDNRIRGLDYGVQFNKLFYQKALSDQTVNLFCPFEAEGLYDAFFADQDLFEELYNKYSADESIPRKTVKAKELLAIFVQERAGTGRVYLQNVDNCNNHGPFNPEHAPIKQSNLCLEIALPTTPLSEDDKDEGEIALCTLAAYNLGTIDYDEIEGLGEIMVRALDALLDYQSYPVKAAEKALGRRALGVGVINYAYYLAKNKLKYSDGSANELTHNLFEKIQFSLLKASNKLAKEQWACRKFKDTRYSEGLLPIDWYNKAVDNLSDAKLLCDWEGLRENIKKYGLRNSTLTALMPAETSALISNATNGIEPPRGLTTTKGSKHGMYKQVVPDVQELFNNYELLWDMKGNKGYLELVAIMQKFVDQSISANTKYNPFDYEGNLVPYSEMVSDIVTAFKYGVKTLYYHNTYDGSGEDNFVEKEEDCGGGACSI